MALEEPQEGDVVLERSGVRVAVAGSFRIYFDNTILDYEDSAFSQGFVLRPGTGPGAGAEAQPEEETGRSGVRHSDPEPTGGERDTRASSPDVVVRDGRGVVGSLLAWQPDESAR